MESAYHEHWLSVLGICFSLLILSLSWVSVYWIKDIRHRTVAFIVMNGVYFWLLCNTFPSKGTALMNQDQYGLFLAISIQRHSLFGNEWVYGITYPAFCVAVLVGYGVYLLVARRKHRKLT